MIRESALVQDGNPVQEPNSEPSLKELYDSLPFLPKHERLVVDPAVYLGTGEFYGGFTQEHQPKIILATNPDLTIDPHWQALRLACAKTNYGVGIRQVISAMIAEPYKDNAHYPPSLVEPLTRMLRKFGVTANRAVYYQDNSRNKTSLKTAAQRRIATAIADIIWDNARATRVQIIRDGKITTYGHIESDVIIIKDHQCYH